MRVSGRVGINLNIKKNVVVFRLFLPLELVAINSKMQII